MRYFFAAPGTNTVTSGTGARTITLKSSITLLCAERGTFAISAGHINISWK